MSNVVVIGSGFSGLYASVYGPRSNTVRGSKNEQTGGPLHAALKSNGFVRHGAQLVLDARRFEHFF